MLEIGKIVNTHGLKGDMKVTLWCDGIETFSALKYVYINNNRYSLLSVKPHKGCCLIKLDGINDINDTAPFINKIVCAKRSDLPKLPENTYYIKDLIGASVYNKGELAGKVKDVFSTPANDVYVVETDGGREILIPAVKEFIKKISIENSRIDAELGREYFDEN